MPRVLMIVERYPPDLGGLATSGARTAAALARAGAEVEVLAWTKALPPGRMEDEPGAPGVTVRRLGLFANWDLSLQHTVNVIEWLHEERGFDVVWGHYLFPAGFMAVQVAETLGVRSIVSARGNDVDRMTFPPGDFARLLWTLQRASAITSVSADLARKIDVLLGREGAAVVVPNVVDLDTFCPGAPDPTLRESLGVAPDEAVLGFAGELRHKKGFPFLLSALTEVRAERPACLVVIGEVRAREQTHLLPFGHEFPEDAARIIVTGRLETPAEVARHLKACDLFLQPSMWDGMPNALLEAMACGCCPLASDAGGMPEVVEHGVSGFLVPKARLNHLGEAILELLGLPEERRAEVGAAARRRIEERFAPPVEEAALGEVLARIAT